MQLIASIERIYQRDTNYSIKCDERWLGGLGICPFQEDDLAEIECAEVFKDGKLFYNIVSLKIRERKGSDSSEKLRFLRGMCFNNACVLLNSDTPPAKVFELARELFDEAERQNFINWSFKECKEENND